MLARTVLPLLAGAVLPLVLPALADPPTYGPQDADAYTHGQMGDFPEVHFQTTDLVAPHILRRIWEPICDADPDYYYFFAPYGFANQHSGPMILDHNGQMVWHNEFFVRSYGLMVQEYKGEPYLTWWTGDDSIRGHGVGNYYMLDQNYQEQRKLGALHNVPADLHEFKITPEETAVITSFVSTPQNLNVFNKPEDGFIWDGAFQEFDIETNELLFEWRASDHLGLDNCMALEVAESTGSKDHPWDFYHINSVDKDPLGNYLVSARYCALSYIDGRTGEILWNLGGLNNSFNDLSGGRVTGMQYQHHARWTDDYTAITLFDNQATAQDNPGRPSRGLKIAVDTDAMTTHVLKEFVHPERWVGVSQGSMQTLDNGNYLLGYGHSAAFAEFAEDGHVACDVQYAALNTGDNGAFRGGAGQSYRVFKQKWKGTPHYDPKVVFSVEEKKMFVSWNGATEVKMWRLEATRDRETWTAIDEVPKMGFETDIKVSPLAWNVFKLTALDKTGNTIKTWTVFSSGAIQAIEDHRVPLHPATTPTPTPTGTNSFLVIIAALLMGAAISTAGLYWWSARRGSSSSTFMLLHEKPIHNSNSSSEDSDQREGLLYPPAYQDSDEESVGLRDASAVDMNGTADGDDKLLRIRPTFKRWFTNFSGPPSPNPTPR